MGDWFKIVIYGILFVGGLVFFGFCSAAANENCSKGCPPNTEGHLVDGPLLPACICTPKRNR